MSRRLELIGIDICGPLRLSTTGNKYIVSIVDAFSRWPECYAVPSTGSDVVAACLADFVCRHGCPEKLVSDQGRDFLSATFTSFCARLVIHREL